MTSCDIHWSQTGAQEQNPAGRASSGAGDPAKSSQPRPTSSKPQMSSKSQFIRLSGVRAQLHHGIRAPAHPAVPARTRAARPPSSCHLSSSGTVCTALQKQKAPHKRFMLLGNKSTFCGVPPCPSVHPESSSFIGRSVTAQSRGKQRQSRDAPGTARPHHTLSMEQP